MILSFIEALILISNAFAIISEKRVLQKYGWERIDYSKSKEGGFQHMKNIMINWLMFARSMKYVLVLANVLTILFEMLT